LDWKIRHGDLRLILWLRFPYIPGGDIAGEVAMGVTRFKPRDVATSVVRMTVCARLIQRRVQDAATPAA
jgi:NADPH:quinone reductase-like Zn-dependent oxidoreductase